MAKNNKSGLTLKNRIGYGCGDAGGVMTFMLMSTFFTRYCLNILGVSSAVLATLLLILEHLGRGQRSLDGCLDGQGFCQAP